MKLHEAKKICRKRLILAIAIGIAAIVGLAVLTLKAIYWLPWNQDALNNIIGKTIQRLIEAIYNYNALLSFIWEIVPSPNFYQWNTSGNYRFIFLSCLLGVAGLLRDSAEHLNSRVKNTIKAAEEEIWKLGLLEKSGHSRTKADFLTLEIQLESKDKWHTRPEGTVLLTVIAGLLLQIINLSLGLI